ncbi:stalk domain-containing protein [Geosporobacter ferrireducens]|uniref:Copper amine oxidase-like N-terminal domain-containing protein n=1 Tax=Geosporobacter ferrireducens TaxID=1424294 RepID=A0A1D8GGX1_9FIRM|nr:stalk domain-containing protein [Geosporobacter ferrireducens]AOT70147.1 hypothetical protein Gferi_11420 [Geosporobacter ferrireducens]
MKSVAKMTTFFVLSCAIFTTNIASGQEVINNSPKIFIDNVEQAYDVMPQIENGRTLIPMRGVFETLGAEVQWDETTKTVKGKKENTEIALTIGSYFASQNNEKVQLEVQPKIVDGRTMIPLRFVSEALGAEVQWDQDTKKINIQTAKKEPVSEKVESTSKPAEPANKSTETAQRHISTEEAIALALKSSHDFELKQKALKKAEEQNDSFVVNLGHYSPSQIQTQKSLQLNRRWAEKQIELTEENIGVQVKNAIDAINLQKVELALTEETVKNYENKLKRVQTLYDTGMESKFNLDMAQKNLAQEKKQKQILEQNLENAYESLNELLGLPLDTRYTSDEDFDYKPLEIADIDQYAKSKVPSLPNIWYQEQQIELLELGLKLYEYNAGLDSYVVKQMDISSAKTSLASSKKNYEETIRSLYNQAKQIEENYKLQQIAIEKLNSSIKLLETQFNAGLITALDLEEQYLSLEQIEFALKKMAVQHNQLKVSIENPHLL